MQRFNHILVANRGEIAVRIFRTARALGYRTTAIYSEADADSLHVRMADQAYLIGPPQAARSYLDIERVVNAAVACGACAIHPGYGFLSENAAFAQACEARGIFFIGPPVHAIELMGNKARAKHRMIDAGVPCVPGYHGADQSDDALLAEARRIGYPIMIKAAAGGGGRGMRLAQSDEDFKAALNVARSESRNAFGSDELILEKAIVRPRHVEVQVLADEHGNIIHLGERDCSVQRRHQKLLEEAPCPAINGHVREHITRAATDVARAIGYRGAGTVEFVLDEASRFYFIEMNTRLQVEHPVTELITGVDLVAQQIHIAQGRALELQQPNIVFTGHAIEARLCAEDPARGFIPSTGRVHVWRKPVGEGIRVDNGIREGQVISPFYDPMVAKIISYGENREAARAGLVHALETTALLGPQTNLGFLTACLTNDTYVAGEATTAFIAEELGAYAGTDIASRPDLLAIAATLQYRGEAQSSSDSTVSVSRPLMGWSSNGVVKSHFEYLIGGDKSVVVVSCRGRELFDVSVGEHSVTVEVSEMSADAAVLRVGGKRVEVLFHRESAQLIHLFVAGAAFQLTRTDLLSSGAEDGADGSTIVAPMHGNVIEVLVRAGDEIRKGDRIVILEAMKIQFELRASVDAAVVKVLVRPGSQVAAHAVLAELAPNQVSVKSPSLA